MGPTHSTPSEGRFAACMIGSVLYNGYTLKHHCHGIQAVYHCNIFYQIMTSYFKGTADAVAEYCSAVNCVKATNTF